MKGNRKRDTKPELALRSALHRKGARYRCEYPIELAGRRPVRADIAFPKARLAVFVDGCFWHKCPEHSTVPRSNPSYWGPKLSRNVERDREVDVALLEAGWRAVRVWEHEDPEKAAGQIVRALGDD
jgi:DNA mismatch endonuclease (patch repair protein)